jgi:hypothetical protein
MIETICLIVIGTCAGGAMVYHVTVAVLALFQVSLRDRPTITVWKVNYDAPPYVADKTVVDVTDEWLDKWVIVSRED